MKIWDKQENRIINESDDTLYIGADGKVYYLYPSIERNIGVLGKEDVSDRYEVRWNNGVVTQ